MNPAATRVRAALRQQVDGERQLRAIEDIVSRLTAGSEPVLNEVTGQYQPVPLDSTRVTALNAALGAHFKLLGKVLPDLKAVEITGEDGEPLSLGGGSDKLVLATKLMALMRDVRDPVVLEHPWLQ